MGDFSSFDIEMLQKNAPYSAPFVQPQNRQFPPHFIPQQPSMYGARGSTIPPRFLPQYQPQFSRRGRFNPYNQPRNEIWCESCDRSFFSPAKFAQHQAEHKRGKINEVNELHAEVKNLDSAEDIAKWREERRKNYPTAKNIELRRKAQEEQMKRGERITERKSRFGQRNQVKNSRNFGRKRNHREKRERRQEEPLPVKDEEFNNQGVSMFKGTAELDDYAEAKDNPLTKLLGMYESSSDSEPDEGSEQSTDKEPSSTLCALPTEPEHLPEPSESSTGIVDKPKVEKSKPPRKNARKNFPSQPKETRVYEGLNYEFLNRRQPPTMLSRLLEKDIRHERNVLLQCVRFVVENDFLDTEK
ncbi:FMR1-interacting protein NUFIP1 [Phlebotomus argentipes]|uniref:FMR1-interacting protein NUFIP1 n=1 Tax=Phlebotomus argentipes TaxID=94469 RepID=UPI002892F60A|nr:FMR1-interacting protein NUFIP1 [Phlebotomus argentipes]